MSFELKPSYAVLDGNNFKAFEEASTGNHYLSERVATVGELDYGLVPKGEFVGLYLAENDIRSDVMIDSIHAFGTNGVADEVEIAIYQGFRGDDGFVGRMKLSNSQMPFNFPTGVIPADCSVWVAPQRGDCIVKIYVKPVEILFKAVPNPIVEG